MNRPGFAFGGKIGGKAKRAWICTLCGAWFDVKPAKNTQCRGSNVKAHATAAQHFASQAEAGKYMELRLLQAVGKIGELKCQPRFDLIVNGVKLGRYIADFQYTDHRDGAFKFCDVKGGAQTEISDLKRRLAQAIYGIKIDLDRR